MKITFEKDNGLTLIYIYLREFEGKLLNTIIDAKCELLISQDNSCIGINVYNENVDGETFILPTIKDVISDSNVNLLHNCEKYSLLFDSKLDIVYKKECTCNIDYNDDGFFGIEIILVHAGVLPECYEGTSVSVEFQKNDESILSCFTLNDNGSVTCPMGNKLFAARRKWKQTYYSSKFACRFCSNKCTLPSLRLLHLDQIQNMFLSE